MFCRIGDFYELFYEDALIASRELQLTLTARDREKKQPMCGVPYHAAEQYIQRLLRKGYRIALCEQMEDPRLTKKIVRREVTRVLTPGTVVDSGLGAEQSNWLAGVCVIGTGAAASIGLALLDLSTGEFRASEFAGPSALAQLSDELGRLRPAEMLFAEGEPLLNAGSTGVFPNLHNPSAAIGSPRPVPSDGASANPLDGVRTRTSLEDWVFTPDYAVPLLRRHFSVHSLDGMGLGAHEAAATAAGALLHYLQKTMQGGLEHIDTIRFFEQVRNLPLHSRLCQRSQSRARRASLLRRIRPDHPLPYARCLLHPHGQAPAPRDPCPALRRPRRDRLSPRRRRRSRRRPAPPRIPPSRHGWSARPRTSAGPHRTRLRRAARGHGSGRNPGLSARSPICRRILQVAALETNSRWKQLLLRDLRTDSHSRSHRFPLRLSARLPHDFHRFSKDFHRISHSPQISLRSPCRPPSSHRHHPGRRAARQPRRRRHHPPRGRPRTRRAPRALPLRLARPSQASRSASVSAPASPASRSVSTPSLATTSRSPRPTPAAVPADYERKQTLPSTPSALPPLSSRSTSRRSSPRRNARSRSNAASSPHCAAPCSMPHRASARPRAASPRSTCSATSPTLRGAARMGSPPDRFVRHTRDPCRPPSRC